jgi:hypothetical protein
VIDLPNFVPLEPRTYYIDPDNDSSTPLRVTYKVLEEGWQQWIGAFKPEEGEERFVGVSITTVTNLNVDACEDQRAAVPPIGPTVDDLASALTVLKPFQVTKPPTDVAIYGYSGVHLELTVPADIPFEARPGGGYFTDCQRGDLRSWFAPGLSLDFYGYEAPGQIEEFWILEVDGTRLMIAATWYPESPPQDIAEMRAILDSIQIEP